MTKTVGLILAAGGSKRLGSPKQLLDWNGNTLLNQVLGQLLSAGCDHCYLVLGHQSQRIESSLKRQNSAKWTILLNRRWEAGQSTSLQVGLRSIKKSTESHNVLVALCDQPRIPTSHYRKLVTGVRDPSTLVAATKYSAGGGVPACFSSSALNAIETTEGDRGARQWIRSLPEQNVRLLACPEASQDIDTPEDCLNRSPKQFQDYRKKHRGTDGTEG